MWTPEVARRFPVAGLLGLCLALSACGKKAPVESLATAAASGGVIGGVLADAPIMEGEPRSLFLWEVARDGHTSHLMGTCHLPIPLERNLPRPQRGFLDAARVLYVETKLTELDKGAMMRATMAEEGHSNRALLGAEDWIRLIAPFAGKLPAPMLDRMHPWAMFVTMQAMDSGGVPSNSPGLAPDVLDVAVIKRAESKGIEVAYLEAVEDQLALFTEVDGGAFIDMMRPSSPTFGQGRAMMADLLRGCWASDLEVAEETVRLMGEEPTAEAMLWRRNDLWMEILPDEFDKGDVFVAVGVGHMFGERGLLQQLEGQGFTVKPVSTTTQSAPLPPAAEQTMALKPAPPPILLDAALVQGWHERLTPMLSPMCSLEGGPLSACIDAPTEVCEAYGDTALLQCLEQEGAGLPGLDVALPAEQQQRVMGCALGTVALVGYLDHGERDASCPMIALMQSPQ